MTFDIRRTEENDKGAFVAWAGDRRAGQMTYSRINPTAFILDHTEVFPGFEGTGLGRLLVSSGVEWARETGQKILPLCPFARTLFSRTPEYADVRYRRTEVNDPSIG